MKSNYISNRREVKWLEMNDLEDNFNVIKELPLAELQERKDILIKHVSLFARSEFAIGPDAKKFLEIQWRWIHFYNNLIHLKLRDN